MQGNSNPRRSPVVVCLIGFMGAGKSTVGTELAQRLGWPFQDLDDVVESRAGASVSEVFQQQGESGFRKIESEALSRLLGSTQTSTVLALGGGAFAHATNRSALQRVEARIVLLSASGRELWRRCTVLDKKVRPLAQNEADFEKLLAERLPLYSEANLTVETEGKTVADIAAEIESRLALFSR